MTFRPNRLHTIALAILLAAIVAVSAFAAGPARPAAAPPAPAAKAASAPSAAAATAPATALSAELPVLFGMKWGDALQPGMEKEAAQGLPPETAFYKRPADKLVLDAVPLRELHYVYENGKLAGFSMAIDAEQIPAMKTSLTKLWGDGQPDKTVTRWFFAGTIATLTPRPGGTIAVLNVIPVPGAK